MKQYLATAVVRLHSGFVRLTPDQARRRRHAVTPLRIGSDVFEIHRQVDFKKGETFGYNGDVTKSMPLQEVTAAGQDAAEAPTPTAESTQQAVDKAVQRINETPLPAPRKGRK